MRQNGAAPTGKHRARLSRWRRLRLAVAGVFLSQHRQCRAGHHRYSNPNPIGGGISRSSCHTCGTVSFDLREAGQPVENKLFQRQDERQTFAILRRELFQRR